MQWVTNIRKHLSPQSVQIVMYLQRIIDKNSTQSLSANQNSTVSLPCSRRRRGLQSFTHSLTNSRVGGKGGSAGLPKSASTCSESSTAPPHTRLRSVVFCLLDVNMTDLIEASIIRHKFTKFEQCFSAVSFKTL